MTATSKSRPKVVASRSISVNYPMVILMKTQPLVLKNETFHIILHPCLDNICIFLLLSCLSGSCMLRSSHRCIVCTFLATPFFLDLKLSRGVCTTNWGSELPVQQTRQEWCKTNPELKHAPRLQSVMWFQFHNTIEKYWICFKCLIK